MAEFNEEELKFLAEKGVDPSTAVIKDTRFNEEELGFLKGKGVDLSTVQIRGEAPNVPSTFSPPLGRFPNQDPRAREGVPLDTTSGLQTSTGTTGFSNFGFNDRQSANMFSSEADRLVVLNQTLDEQGITERARISKGSLIVPRRNPDTGRIEDVVVDEDQFTMRDISDLFGDVLPVVGALVALRKGKPGPAVAIGKKVIGQPSPAQVAASFKQATQGFRRPKTGPGFLESLLGKGFFRDATASAVGAGTGRAVNDALARQAAGIEGNESLFELGKQEALADFVLGGGATAAFRVGRYAVNFLQAPLASINVKAANQALLSAKANLQRKFGFTLETTPGEMTMSEKLIAYEGFVGGQPGGSAVKEVMQARNNVERQYINAILETVEPGKNLDLSPQRFDLKLTSDLFEDIDRTRLTSKVSREQAAKDSEKHIVESIGSMTTPERMANLDDVGTLVREGVTSRKKLFDMAMEDAYGTVKQLTTEFQTKFGDQVDFDQLVKLDSLGPIVDKFQKNSKVLRVEEVIKTAPINPATGLSKTEKEVRRVMKVDHDLLNATGSKWAAKAKEFSGGIPLGTAQRMRRELSNDISFGEGLSDETERFLHQLRDGITDSIEKSVGDLPSGELRDAFVSANKAYSEGITQFQNRYASRFLVKNTNSRSFIDDAQVLRDLATNPRSYREIMEFMKDNPEARASVNRGILDERVVLSSPGGVLDLKTFRSQLNSLPRETRERVLGKQGPAFLAAVELAVKAQSKLTRKAKIRATDFIELFAEMQSGEPVANWKKSIAFAIEDKSKMDAAFNTGVRKKLKRAESLEEIDEKQLASVFIDEASEKEVDELVARYGNGEERKALQLETLVNLFERAQGKKSSTAIQNNIVGDVSVDFDAEQFFNVITDKRNNAKYRKILGPEIMDSLADLMIVKNRGQIVKNLAGGGSGASLAAGAQFAKLSQFTNPMGMISAMSRGTQFRVVASMLARPSLRKLLERTYTLPEWKAISQAIFASSPLISDVVEGISGNIAKSKAVSEMSTAFGVDLADRATQADDEQPEDPTNTVAP